MHLSRTDDGQSDIQRNSLKPRLIALSLIKSQDSWLTLLSKSYKYNFYVLQKILHVQKLDCFPALNTICVLVFNAKRFLFLAAVDAWKPFQILHNAALADSSL